MILHSVPRGLRPAKGLINGFILSIIFWAVMACLWMSVGHAQTWKQGSDVTVAWDAVTSATGTISYKLYYKPAAGGTETFSKAATTTQATLTLPEGRWYLGVSTVKTMGADSVESSINWSDNPAVTFQAQTFGVFYIAPAPPPVGIRPLN